MFYREDIIIFLISQIKEKEVMTGVYGNVLGTLAQILKKNNTVDAENNFEEVKGHEGRS